jgi:hypothetical protein
VGISSLVASTWLITSIALAASPVIAINQDAATANVTGQALREHLSVLMGSGAILASSMARTDYFSSMRASQSHGRKLSPHSARPTVLVTAAKTLSFDGQMSRPNVRVLHS